MARIRRSLPDGGGRALGAAAVLARRLRTPVYLVGGAVRDLMRRRPVRDLDLVVEGDGLGFARRLARQLSASVREHPRFATATLGLPEGGTLDVASARTEVYRRSGALPEVRLGSIEEDLARRDFTVNAMALRLAPGAPRLLDPHGGRTDLDRGLLRMLHPGSALDDPTRSFRAVLYANRLGFRIEPRTRRWIREAVRDGATNRISGDRLRRELARLLSEPGRAAAVSLLARLGLAHSVHPGLSAGPQTRARLVRAERPARSSPGATWFAFLLVWTAAFTATEAEELCRRLNLPRARARALKRWAGLLARVAAGGGCLPPGLSADEALALAALRARSRGGRPFVDLAVRGRDLVGAGVAPGPAIGRALEATRLARQSGRIGAEKELAFALGVARGEGR